MRQLYSGGRPPRATSPEVTLRLSNIGEAQEEDVRNVLAQYGRLRRVHVPTDRATQQVRGFAFVSCGADAAYRILHADLRFEYLKWHAEEAEQRPY